jgi:membrane-bound lytic murein transglycosylase D
MAISYTPVHCIEAIHGPLLLFNQRRKMRLHFKQTGFLLCTILSLFLALSGCTTGSHQQTATSTGNMTPTDISPQNPSVGPDPSTAFTNPEETARHFPEMVNSDDAFSHHDNKEDQPSFSRSDGTEKSNQELLDSALEFCNASNDFWEQGDLENAIDALDESYAIILRIDHNQSPEIQQQIDDLRFTISQTHSSGLFIPIHGLKRQSQGHSPGHESPCEESPGFVQRPLQEILSGGLPAIRKYRPFIVKRLKEAGLARGTLLAAPD